MYVVENFRDICKTTGSNNRKNLLSKKTQQAQNAINREKGRKK